MHGVAERQQAGLAKQDVVGEREHDGDADQVKSRQSAAGGKDQRQHDERRRRCKPQPVELQACGQRLSAELGRVGRGATHVSRVPRSPMGRTIRIATIST